MPIEFRCPGCSKLLQTPDQAAGKKAKCPQCGTITDVPASGAPASDLPPSDVTPRSVSPPTGEIERSPFADRPRKDPFAPPPPVDFNPYATPSAVTPPVAAQGPLLGSTIDFGQLFSRSWEIFTSQLGPCVLVGLVLLGVRIGLWIFQQVGGMASQLSGEIAIILAFQSVNMTVSFLVQTWLNLGTLKFAINLSRTGQGVVGDFFSVGPYFLRGLLLSLLIAAISIAIVVVSLIPAGAAFAAIGPRNIDRNPVPVVLLAIAGICLAVALVVWILFRFLLSQAFIVDRDSGVIESMGLSNRYLQGNKLILFCAMIVASLAAGAFTMITCCLGQVFAVPFMGVFTAVAYLLATGQMPGRLGAKPAEIRNPYAGGSEW